MIRFVNTFHTKEKRMNPLHWQAKKRFSRQIGSELNMKFKIVSPVTLDTSCIANKAVILH